MPIELGSTDCERIGEGFLTQPVNSLTSLTFVIAGLAIWWRRPDRREFAALVALVGMGSFLAHGPRWPGSEWLHDVTLAWVLAAIASEGSARWQRYTLLATLAAVFAAAPVVAVPVSVGLAAAAIGREAVMRARRRPATAKALGLAGIGVGIGTLSRTGWPLCDPDSLLQGHGAWHVLASLALMTWALGTPPRDDDEERG